MYAISFCFRVSFLERKYSNLWGRKLQTISESKVCMRQNFQPDMEQWWWLRVCCSEESLKYKHGNDVINIFRKWEIWRSSEKCLTECSHKVDLGSLLCKQNTITVAIRFVMILSVEETQSSFDHPGLSELKQFSQFMSGEALYGRVGIRTHVFCLLVFCLQYYFFIHLGRNVLFITFLPVFPYYIHPNFQRANPLLIQRSPNWSL